MIKNIRVHLILEKRAVSGIVPQIPIVVQVSWLSQFSVLQAQKTIQ